MRLLAIETSTEACSVALWVDGDVRERHEIAPRRHTQLVPPWAEELLAPATAADVRRLPRLYTAAGYACFAGRAEAARVNAHRAAELEVDPRYDACEPG